MVKAKNKTKNLNNVEASVGDLNNINYEDRYFDVALACQCVAIYWINLKQLCK